VLDPDKITEDEMASLIDRGFLKTPGLKATDAAGNSSIDSCS
jgi:hypothetical protein